MNFRKIIFLLISKASFLCSANSEFLEMGESSYGNPTIVWGTTGRKCTIGNYCSIAGNVVIFLGGDHRVDWITTYPFPAFFSEASSIQGFEKTKGNVIIGNDVWIGTGVLLLSGVTVGDGAVIGAHAVVAKDVPPYTIFAGNPARLIRYRFDADTIEKLLKIKWWDWNRQQIVEVLPLLCSNRIELFINFCERKKLIPE